jgi:hypothetical protein
MPERFEAAVLAAAADTAEIPGVGGDSDRPIF